MIFNELNSAKQFISSTKEELKEAQDRDKKIKIAHAILELGLNTPKKISDLIEMNIDEVQIILDYFEKNQWIIGNRGGSNQGMWEFNVKNEAALKSL